jgi:uncharacterized protein (TIGR02246 family)
MVEAGADPEALLAEYGAAVLAKDPGRLAALYAPDVRVFDTWSAWSFEDHAAWSRSLHDWLGSLGDETVQVRFDEVRVARHADTAAISAFTTYSAVDAAGQVLRSMQNRLSWFLTRTAGGWVIAHEHTSVPIGEDLKGKLSRG